MSLGAIIGLSLGFMIFVIITTVVYLKRRAKANQNLGYTIHDGAGKLIYHRQTFLSVDYEFRNSMYFNLLEFFFLSTYSTHCGHIGYTHWNQ